MVRRLLPLALAACGGIDATVADDLEHWAWAVALLVTAALLTLAADRG